MHQAFYQFRVSAFADALALQGSQTGHAEMVFFDRLGAFLSAKEKRHDSMSCASISDAKFKLHAAPKELKATRSREFDLAQMRELLKCSWADHGRNILLSGETGTAKTWLACCIGTSGIRYYLKTRCFRVADLSSEIGIDCQATVTK